MVGVDAIVFADALPRTPTGKVRKLELRAAHAEHYQKRATLSS